MWLASSTRSDFAASGRGDLSSRRGDKEVVRHDVAGHLLVFRYLQRGCLGQLAEPVVVLGLTGEVPKPVPCGPADYVLGRGERVHRAIGEGAQILPAGDQCGWGLGA